MDSTAFTITRTISIRNVPGPELLYIRSVAMDGVGGFFIADEFNHRVIALDPEGACVRVIGAKGNAPGEFWYPRGLAVIEDAGERLLAVCDAWNHRIQMFDMAGAPCRQFGSIGEGINNFNEPNAIAAAADGALWILDRGNHRVKKVTAQGRVILTFGERSSVAMERAVNPARSHTLRAPSDGPWRHGFTYPVDFAPCPDGSLLIADTGNQRLVQVNDLGEFIRELYILDEEREELLAPDSVAVMSNGDAVAGVFGRWYTIISPGAPWRSLPFDLGERPGGAHICFAPSGEALIADPAIPALHLVTFAAPVERRIPAEYPARTDGKPVAGCDLVDARREVVFARAMAMAEREPQAAGALLPSILNGIISDAQRITALEESLLGGFREYYTKFHTLFDNPAGRFTSGDLHAEMQAQSLSMHSLLEERGVLIHSMAAGLGRAARVARLPGVDGPNETAAMLTEAFAHKSGQYQQVHEWLEGSLVRGGTVDFAAGIHAVSALVLTHEHLELLDRALGLLLPEGRFEAPPLPKALAGFGEGAALLNLPPLIVLTLGKLFLERGNSDTALMLLRHGMASDNPQRRPFYRDLAARTLIAKGDTTAALELYETALRENPRDAKILLSLAAARAAAGDRRGAIAGLERIAAAPDSAVAAQALLERAKLHVELGEYDAAHGLVKDDEPFPAGLRAEAMNLAAAALVNSRRFDDAREVLVRLAGHDDVDPATAARAANFCVRAGLFDAALTLSERALTPSSGDAALAAHITALSCLGRAEEAVARPLPPGAHSLAREAFARALMLLGRLDEALAALGQLDDPRLVYHAAIIHALKGEDAPTKELLASPQWHGPAAALKPDIETGRILGKTGAGRRPDAASSSHSVVEYLLREAMAGNEIDAGILAAHVKEKGFWHNIVFFRREQEPQLAVAWEKLIRRMAELEVTITLDRSYSTGWRYSISSNRQNGIHTLR